MKNSYASWVMIVASLCLGSAASTLVSGCQQSKPIAADSEETEPPSVEVPERADDSSTAVTDEPSDEPRSESETATASTDIAAKPETEPEQKKQLDSEKVTVEEQSGPKMTETTEQPEATTDSQPDDSTSDQTAAVEKDIPVDKSANAEIKPGDWPMWLGTAYRNNTPEVNTVPTDWSIGEFDRQTGEWLKDDAKNIKWVSRLGSQTYGNAVVAGGQVYVGTNNGAGYLKRYPYTVDLGCLLCFRESDGQFLWQHSNEKLPTGRVHDWELQGVCSTAYAEGDRLWYVTNRGHVVCLDAEGFYDGEDDGPVQKEAGRLFEVTKNDNPDLDKVAGMIAALDEGNLTEDLRTNFASAGMELPEEIDVKTDDAGKKWTLTAKVGDSEREVRISLTGPKLNAFKVITPDDKDEADVVWDFDMMKELGVSQHNMCSCSVVALGDILFVITSNGVDESHLNIPAPDAPSFMAMDKNSGEVFWTDKSPGLNILHGQWSSPSVAVLGGVPQVLFAGGDGWLRSFRGDKGKDGKPELLWEFDANPKTSKWILGGRGTRNNIIATPVIYDGLVYVAVGQDPEHGEGIGHLWCIDPTKRGDVSPQLAVDVNTRKPIPHKRIQAVIPEDGEVAIDNSNSAAIWHYSEFDWDGNGRVDFEETMHRTIGTVAIKNDLLFISDFSGLFHCLDAKSGKQLWTYDMLAAAWGSPLIADDKVFIGDEDGDIAIFDLSGEQHDPIAEINMENSVYSTPVVANGVLYIANKSYLFAIAEQPDAAE